LGIGNYTVSIDSSSTSSSVCNPVLFSISNSSLPTTAPDIGVFSIPNLLNNDPEIINADIFPQPLINGQGGILSFEYRDSLDDLPIFPHDQVRITVCLLNSVPANGLNSVSGSYSSKFTWVYDPISNCFQGRQNQMIPGNGASGEIVIEFFTSNYVNCPDNHIGFNVNLQPMAAMNPINDQTNDADFHYTCVEWDCPAALQDSIDICTLLNTPLGTMDCDNGGASNQQECLAGTSLSNPTDDCYAIGSCPSLLIAPNSLLESAYNATTGNMPVDLQQDGYLTNRSPYSDTKLLPQPSSAPTYQDVVDWVWIELRDTQDPTQVITGTSALLLKDGQVVDGDGVSDVALYASSGTYHLVFKHRNHLSVMTTNTFALSNTPTTIDFTTEPLYGTNAAKTINGLNILHSGDANGDGTVNAADRSKIWNDRNLTGYLESDLNLDGVCNAADRSNAWNNRNLVAQLP